MKPAGQRVNMHYILYRTTAVVGNLKASCWLGCGLSILLSLAVYLGNGRAHPSGDTLGARLTPISLLTEGNLNLDEFRDEVFPGKRYGMIRAGGHYYSSYPLGAAFTAMPLYALASVVRPGLYTEGMKPYYAARYGDEKATVAYWSEKASAAIITAISTGAIWVLVFRLAGFMPALLLTLAYAFGTPAMSSSSQALWTHGASCLSLAVALSVLVHAPSSRMMLVVAGVALGWSIFCRPTNLLTCAVFAPWILFHWKWRAFWVVTGAAITLAATASINLAIYGKPLGGYAGQTTMLVAFQWESIAGVLFSPSRGLLVFSSFLLPALFGGFVLMVRRPASWGTASFLAAMAGIAFCGFWPVWGGGYSFGPRLLADVVPLLITTLAAMAATGATLFCRPVKLLAFCTLVALSIAVHVLGAYRGDRGWNGGYYTHQAEALWQVRNSQFFWTLFGRPK